MLPPRTATGPSTSSTTDWMFRGETTTSRTANRRFALHWDIRWASILFPSGPTSAVPATSFGRAEVGTDDATCSDFRFDLEESSLFAAPFAAGDWVFELQSKHGTASSDPLRVIQGHWFRRRAMPAPAV